MLSIEINSSIRNHQRSRCMNEYIFAWVNIMKLSSLVCAVWIGVTTPTIATLTTLTASAIAAPEMPQGLFMDRDWGVNLEFKAGTYHYRGTNHRTGKTLELAGASVSGTNTRRIYTWNNAGTRYRVIWQPKDRDYIRLQVIDPNGTERLNRLLAIEYGC